MLYRISRRRLDLSVGHVFMMLAAVDHTKRETTKCNPLKIIGFIGD